MRRPQCAHMSKPKPVWEVKEPLGEDAKYTYWGAMQRSDVDKKFRTGEVVSLRALPGKESFICLIHAIRMCYGQPMALGLGWAGGGQGSGELVGVD